MSKQAKIGVIGGSGLYGMAGLTNISEEQITTPFGKTSAPIVVGTLEGKEVAFLGSARDRTCHQPQASALPCQHLCPEISGC